MKSKLSFREKVFALFLFFLPFTQALTINVGFPFKISEMLLFLLIFIDLVSRNALEFKISKTTLTLLIFILLTFFSFIVNAFYPYPYNLSGDASRFGPLADSILKMIYVLMAIVSMIITIAELKKSPKLINFFLLGAVVSSSYSWYLFVSGVLKIPVVLLPGMDDPLIMRTSFGDIIRCGTFKEGNFMGLYLVMVAIIALYRKRPGLSIFFFLTILTTFSTAAIMSSIVFLILYLINKYKQYKLKLISALGALTLVLFLLVQFNSTFKSYFYNKLFGSIDTVEDKNDVFSKVDRLNTVTVGLTMFYNNPLIGVGLSNYSLHYYHYNLLPELDTPQVKRIPNNIYVEVLSETGIFSALIFLFFLYQVYQIGKRKSALIISSGLIACYFYFFAFPSFTLLFIWVFFGIVCSSNRNQSDSVILNGDEPYIKTIAL